MRAFPLLLACLAAAETAPAPSLLALLSDSQDGGFGALFAIAKVDVSTGAPQAAPVALLPAVGALGGGCFAVGGGGVVAACTTLGVMPDCLAFLHPDSGVLLRSVCDKQLVISSVAWDAAGATWLVGAVNTTLSAEPFSVYYLPHNATAITHATRRVFLGGDVQGGTAVLDAATRTLTVAAGDTGNADLISMDVATGAVAPRVHVPRAINLALLLANASAGVLAWGVVGANEAVLQGVDVATGAPLGAVLASLADADPVGGCAASDGQRVAAALLSVPAGAGSLWASVGQDGKRLVTSTLGGAYPFVLGLAWAAA